MEDQEKISRTTEEYVKWTEEQLIKKDLELHNSDSYIPLTDFNVDERMEHFEISPNHEQNSIYSSGISKVFRSAIRNAIVPLIPFISKEKRASLKKKYE